MRFLENGPSIPNDLLTARDEGRVVFFCGAGVSRAKAGLPDFIGLTTTVLDQLGAAAGSEARRLLSVMRDGAPISADHIFGLLEQDFPFDVVRAKVSEALRPARRVDTSAHRTLLDLARCPDGAVRLVTTNFDRLFLRVAERTVKCWTPPLLPDLRRRATFEGIVHLHGITNKDYTGIEGEEFVVSSADFGHAYLSEGWAANFMRQLLQRFQIVFVGYSADDPPIRYLLEALGRTATSTAGLYAFQDGLPDEAQARWRSKGVDAIAYDGADRHAALWSTLDAWAARARDPQAWTGSVIAMARRGPADLAPHERGQVAHLVSTDYGAKVLAQADPPPPAEWLCVFDPAIRFGKPGNLGRYFEVGEHVDPFDRYGIDDDPAPARVAPDDHFTKREVPKGAWSALATQTGNSPAGRAATFAGPAANAPAALPPRLWSLGVWLSMVCHEPAAVWWATKQGALHPDVRDWIRWAVDHKAERFGPVVKRAWRHLLASWAEEYSRGQRDWYDLKKELAADGWTVSTAERIATTLQPRLTVAGPFWGGPIPPRDQPDLGMNQLFTLRVEYPEWQTDVDIPVAHLASMVRAVGRMLERATVLEAESGKSGLRLERPLTPDPDVRSNDPSFIRGLDGLLAKYVNLFNQLIAHSVSAAHTERTFWPVDDHVFARLRMWAAGRKDLTTPAEAGRLLTGLSSCAFWDAHHQRDLLVAIEARWADFPARTRSALAGKLVKGPPRWPRENRTEFREQRAAYALDRIHWLKTKGIDLPAPAEAIEDLRRVAPKWREEHAAGAAVSMECRAGLVVTDPSPTPLLNEPLASLIDAADRLRRRHPKDFLREEDPFQGYVQLKPVRALAALMLRTKTGEFPTTSWNAYLNSEARKNDRSRLTILIACRLTALPTSGLATIAHPVTSWMRVSAETLFRDHPDAFRALWDAVLRLLRAEPDVGKSAIIHSSRGRDWLEEGINAPAGQLANALFEHPVLKDRPSDSCLPPEWRRYVEELLDLPGSQQLHVAAVLCRRLDWFHAVDPGWTEARLIQLAETGGTDAVSAFWDGLRYAGRLSLPLFLRVKPLVLARVSGAQEREAPAFAAMLLSGWITKGDGHQTRMVTDEELRDCLLRGGIEFRHQVLWNLANWLKEDTASRRGDVLAFLRNVWPRQHIANGSRETEGLLRVLLTLDDDFPAGVEAVIRCLTPLDRHASMAMYDLDEPDTPEGALVRRFPDAVLEILYRILPVDMALWPHNTRAVLGLIAEQDSTLTMDSRLLELRRKLERGR